MGGFVFLLLLVYAAAAFFTARRHYAAMHGVPYTRHTPLLTNSSTFVGLLWPVALFHEPWQNPQRCRHLQHVEQRAALRSRVQDYEQALKDEAEGWNR